MGEQGAAGSEASRGEGWTGARERGLSSDSVPATPHPEPVRTSKQGEGVLDQSLCSSDQCGHRR